MGLSSQAPALCRRGFQLLLYIFPLSDSCSQRCLGNAAFSIMAPLTNSDMERLLMPSFSSFLPSRLPQHSIISISSVLAYLSHTGRYSSWPLASPIQLARWVHILQYSLVLSWRSCRNLFHLCPMWCSFPLVLPAVNRYSICVFSQSTPWIFCSPAWTQYVIFLSVLYTLTVLPLGLRGWFSSCIEFLHHVDLCTSYLPYPFGIAAHVRSSKQSTLTVSYNFPNKYWALITPHYNHNIFKFLSSKLWPFDHCSASLFLALHSHSRTSFQLHFISTLSP